MVLHEICGKQNPQGMGFSQFQMAQVLLMANSMEGKQQVAIALKANSKLRYDIYQLYICIKNGIQIKIKCITN